MKEVKKPEEPTTKEKAVIVISAVVVMVLVTITIIYTFLPATPVQPSTASGWSHPCKADWRWDCTETSTEAEPREQMRRAKEHIDDLEQQVAELQSLPTAKKEFEKKKIDEASHHRVTVSGVPVYEYEFNIPSSYTDENYKTSMTKIYSDLLAAGHIDREEYNAYMKYLGEEDK